MNKNSVSIHLVLNNVIYSTRLFSITQSLIKNNLVTKCIIIGLWNNGLKELEYFGENILIVRIKTPFCNLVFNPKSNTNQILIYILLILRNFYIYANLLIYCIRIRNAKYVSCHISKLLIFSVFIKIIKNIKLIYLPHELESHKFGISKLNSFLTRLKERIFLRFVYNIIVVNDQIREWYKNEYNLTNIFVLTNMHFNNFSNRLIKSNKLRDEFKIPESDIIFIYQGLIDISRGCQQILDTFSKANKDRHIIMMGFGKMTKDVLELSLKYNNIHFKPAVKFDQILEYTSSADIGIHFLFEKPSLSYNFSMPNKFFEYILSGIPILVCEHYIYQSEFIIKNGVGWSLYANETNFLNFINNINFNDILKLNNNIHKLQDDLIKSKSNNSILIHAFNYE
jgi:hypothetical protein